LPPASPSDQALRARLAWRCRRGMKELDLLLLGWLQREYPSATEARRGQFEALLELPDPELAAYLLGLTRPEGGALAALVESIQGGQRIMSSVAGGGNLR
jgi:antitoxin CptB